MCVRQGRNHRGRRPSDSENRNSHVQNDHCNNGWENIKGRLKLDGTPENVPLYPFEILGRLSELNLLDYSAQIIEEASVDDLDPNERIRECCRSIGN